MWWRKCFKCNNIIDTWGEETHPYSFCYLGEANYDYEILKKFLEEKKRDETKIFKEKGKTYYNALVNNCQNFSDTIEKILFKNKKFWHSFNYYIDDFFQLFFRILILIILKWNMKMI